MGIVVAGQWDRANDEELENAVKLTAFALRHFATFLPIVLDYVKPLLSEAWRRVMSKEACESGGRCQRLADWLTAVVYSAVIGGPHRLIELEFNFNALYNAASNAGKLLLLDTLFYALPWEIDGVKVAAVLLGKPQLSPRRAFKELAKRVKELVSQLVGIEKTFVVASLYPWLSKYYTFFSEFDSALKFAKKSLETLNELQNAYEKDKAMVVEKLRPYLELRQIRPDLEKELNVLSQLVYSRVALVYMVTTKELDFDKAVECAVMACDLAKKLGDVYYEVESCGLLTRLRAIRDGVPPVKEFEKLWQKASQIAGLLGAEAITTTLGNYVIALISEGRREEVETVLKEWSWALELHPVTPALTYGVLSLFDGQYLEKAERRVEYLIAWARTYLSEIKDIDKKTILETMDKVVRRSSRLFLLALVGLAYCKRGEEWGLKLAREAAQAGSHRFKGIVGRLFGDLYKALECATVGNCVTEEVLRAVYKLYYVHV